MRIGIDGRSLKTSRAVSRYTKNLVNNLSRIDSQNEYLLFLDGGTKLREAEFLKLSPNWRLTAAPAKWVLRDHFLFGRFLKKFNLDIFLHPDNTEFLFCHPQSVVVLHDLIPFLLPAQSLSPHKLIYLRQRFYLELQQRAFKKSKMIITVSQNSKEDITRLFDIGGERITVVSEGTEEVFKPPLPEAIAAVKEKIGVRGDYILCHSGFSPYKNLLRLVDAFAGFRQEFPDLSLIISGRVEDSAAQVGKSYFQELKEEILRQGIERSIVFTGFVEEEDLPALYGGARVFVFPSLYEGFGLPPLEAQACGTAVASSRAASLPEVLGRSALLFNPEKTEEITDALLQLVKNSELRYHLVEEGFKNVSRFSWESCAVETLKVLESVVKD